MSGETVFTNARLVLHDEIVDGTLSVRDGRIAAIEAGHTSVAGAIDLEGDHLIPGLIELHTDHFETQAFPRPSVKWPMGPALLAHDAAVFAAGITTVFNAIAVGHDAGKKAYRADLVGDVLETIDATADWLRADHLVHLRCEVTGAGMAEQFERSRAHPRMRLVSIMDHTPGQRQFVSLDKYREYYMGKYAIASDDMESQIEQRLEMQDRYALDNRALVTGWCHEYDVTMASHDDACAEHIRESAADGVSIAEFPTTIEAAKAAHATGMATVAGAPNLVRGGSHSGNVGAHELADDGLLDVFSSDYVPNSLLHAAWGLQERGWSLPHALLTVTAHPAGLLGLTDRGRLETGRRADLVRLGHAAHGPVVRQIWREGQAHA